MQALRGLRQHDVDPGNRGGRGGGVLPQLDPAHPPFRKLPLDHVLCGNPGMVRARNPKNVIAIHSLVAAEYILEGIVKRMPHVERARDIGRGNDHGEGLAVRTEWAKVSRIRPARIPGPLYFAMRIRLIDLPRHLLFLLPGLFSALPVFTLPVFALTVFALSGRCLHAYDIFKLDELSIFLFSLGLLLSVSWAGPVTP